MNVVNIGGMMVGDGHPPVFMAEIGTFFNQDIGVARHYIKAAVDAGVPVIKTEILHNPDVCLNTELLTEYSHATGTKAENYRELIERKVVPLKYYGELFEYCDELGVPFVASCYDFEGVDFLVKMGGAAIKIWRSNVVNFPLIRHAARTGLPVIFDTGFVYLEEVVRAVRVARAEGAHEIIVNHHPGANPAPPELHNMCMLQTYKESLGVPVGLSCHYRGDEILYLAIGMGCNLLEKGIDANPDRVEQNVISALSLHEIAGVLRKIDNCWKAIGQKQVSHEPRNLSIRCGLVTKQSIAVGERLGLHNVRFAWPPLGISVQYWDTIENSRVTKAIDVDQAIYWEDIRLEES